MSIINKATDNNTSRTKTRTLNRAVSDYIPDSNDHISLCLRDFTKMILNMKPRGDKRPDPPNTNELEALKETNQTEIISNTNFFETSSTDEKLYGGKKSIPGKYKEKCQKELQYYGILVPTFQWDTKGITAWDSLVLKVIIKHWLHAKSEGAFSNYAIDTEYSKYETLFGLSERWLRGQKDEFKKPHVRKTGSKSRVKQKIFDHRVSTAKQFLGEDLAKSLLPSIECCSDTEENLDGEYNSIFLPWRSEIYTQFLHNLDNNTLNWVNEMKGKRKAIRGIEYSRKYTSKVQEYNSNPCQHLPSNCYSDSFVNSLSWTEKLILDMKKPEDNLGKIAKSLENTRSFD